MVLFPPRHGKSSFCSEYFPPWYLGWFPDDRVILSSYEATFAASWGRKARAVVEEHGHLLGIGLSKESSAVSEWELARPHRGGMVTAGVGGAITGRGANCLIIDDPVRNAQDANSPTYRETAWDWYRSTAKTRLEPDAIEILIMTRWHEDDLGGRLLFEMRNGGEEWEVLELPAIATGTDWRPEGEALWPERYPLEVLEERRRTMGSYWFSAMFQQRPQPAGGGLFKKVSFRYFEGARTEGTEYILRHPGGRKVWQKHHCWRFTTVDLAASVRTSADYTVMSTWAVTPDTEMLLVDRIRERLEGPGIVPMMQTVQMTSDPGYQAVEATGFQLSIVQDALKAGLPIRPLQAKGDKWARAQPAAARVEGGMVYFPADAPWLQEWEDELVVFPAGAHDDQVDTLSYAAIEVARQSGDPSEQIDMVGQRQNTPDRFRELGLNPEDERYYDSDREREDQR